MAQQHGRGSEVLGLGFKRQRGAGGCPTCSEWKAGGVLERQRSGPPSTLLTSRRPGPGGRCGSAVTLAPTAAAWNVAFVFSVASSFPYSATQIFPPSVKSFKTLSNNLK